MLKSNAIVDYVNIETGEIIESIEFYDPGLDINSWYTKEQQKRGVWQGLHLAYGCGRAKCWSLTK